MNDARLFGLTCYYEMFLNSILNNRIVLLTQNSTVANESVRRKFWNYVKNIISNTQNNMYRFMYLEIRRLYFRMTLLTSSTTVLNEMKGTISIKFFL